MTALNVETRLISSLRPYAGNARTHSKKQVTQIAESIRRFGFVNPVLISDDDQILAGHGRVMAARQLGMTEVSTIRLSHLSEVERRAYILADNKLALNAGWDKELLSIELQALIDLDFDVTLTGFSLAEIDLTLDEARESDPEAPAEPEDDVPPLPENPVSRTGAREPREGQDVRPCRFREGVLGTLQRIPLFDFGGDARELTVCIWRAKEFSA